MSADAIREGNMERKVKKLKFKGRNRYPQKGQKKCKKVNIGGSGIILIRKAGAKVLLSSKF
jgi:hypothetical protein